MALSVIEYRPVPKEALKVVFAGEFFSAAPEAEFNQMLALALLDEGVKIGILNRGPRDWFLGATDERLELLEQLEKNLPRNPDFYLCYGSKDHLGFSGTPVFRLLSETAAGGNGEYACGVMELKPPGFSWQEAARNLVDRLEALREKPRRYQISEPGFVSCFFGGLTKRLLMEETCSSLRFAVPGVELKDLPPEDTAGAKPEDWVFLVEEGERLHLEDREVFEKVFFSTADRLVFLEAVPLDVWGLEHLLVPSLRFLRGRTAKSFSLPAGRSSLSHQGQWAPVRIIRPRFLANKRRERMLSEREQGLPAYHYHHLLAVDAVAVGKPGEALTAFQAAYREAPEPYRALVLRNLSLALIHHERYEEALGILQDGEKLYPTYTDLGYLTGLAHWKQQCYDDALQECLRAAEKGEATDWYYSDPGAGNYKPIFLVAEIYRKKGNLKGAMSAYVGSLTYNPYFLPALERLAQMRMDSPAVANKVLELLLQLLDLRRPEVEAAFGRTLEKYSEAFTFKFCGQPYHYFCHYYNQTWDNERAVEIPIIKEFIMRYQGKRILEVGNVLAHYFPVEHEVLDKYEKAPRVLNQDVVDFNPKQKYDLIVSVSTLEHVGWDEEPREPTKILRAVEVLKGALAADGEMVVTLPLGYNAEMDKMLEDGRLSFTECYGLKRISTANEWVEVPWREVLGMEYGRPYPAANGLIIGIIRK
ncbi:MAG: tetratricopeptide repeat protein [Bacillota bacterium]